MTTSIYSKNSTQSAIQVNGVDAVVIDATGITSGADSGIKSLSASVAGNALTVGLAACSLQFRASTLASGVVNQRSTGAVSLVIPSGATLGTVSGNVSRIVLIALDNAGSVELAVVNIAGGINLDETSLISTTAIGAASTASNVIYSTTARTGLPFRVVGFIDSTQTTAGTWATAPTTVQGIGGQALAALSSLGYGQSWQAVTRALGTTYYNTTGKPITLSLYVQNGASPGGGITVSVNGGTAFAFAYASAQSVAVNGVGSVIIPANASYLLASIGTSTTITSATELR